MDDDRDVILGPAGEPVRYNEVILRHLLVEHKNKG